MGQGGTTGLYYSGKSPNGTERNHDRKTAEWLSLFECKSHNTLQLALHVPKEALRRWPHPALAHTIDLARHTSAHTHIFRAWTFVACCLAHVLPRMAPVRVSQAHDPLWKNQDAGLVIAPLDRREGQALFAIFDGEGAQRIHHEIGAALHNRAAPLGSSNIITQTAHTSFHDAR